MKKFACILTALTLFGVATPAKAQYFFADSGGVVIGADAYAASPGYVYSSPGYAYSSWWGGAGYGYSSYSRWGAPYAYSGWWGGAGYAYTAPGAAYALAPGYEAYAAVPACRIVHVRRHLPDGTVVLRRTRVC
jgi:hypothetical protein